MAQRRGAVWRVSVRPTGTADEASLAAKQARRLVASWIERDRAGQAGREGDQSGAAAQEGD